MVSQANFTKFLECYQFSIIFFRNKSRETSSQFFYEASITLMPKSDKYVTGKENNKPITLINTGVKTFKKILAKQIQQCVKGITHHD